MSRGLTLEDARDYNIIGCVEPQKAGKTDGWHDAAFYNMCRPLEMVFKNGYEDGEKVGVQTGDVAEMTSFDEVFAAYKAQSDYMVALLVNADNAIDVAHAERCPLPFLSCMIEDCVKRGKTVQEGGAVYNFTGPQGFGIANMTDALWVIKKLVFEEGKYTLSFIKDALEHNYGKDMDNAAAEKLTVSVCRQLAANGKKLSEADVATVYETVKKNTCSEADKAAYDKLLKDIADLPKYGNDVKEVDEFAREIAYVYTKEIEKYSNPRGGRYQAGLYPVSANVPLGAQTGGQGAQFGCAARVHQHQIARGVRNHSGPACRLGPLSGEMTRLQQFLHTEGILLLRAVGNRRLMQWRLRRHSVIIDDIGRGAQRHAQHADKRNACCFHAVFKVFNCWVSPMRVCPPTSFHR